MAKTPRGGKSPRRAGNYGAGPVGHYMRTRSQRNRSKGSRRFTTISGRRLYASPQRYPRLYEWIISVGDSTE